MLILEKPLKYILIFLLLLTPFVILIAIPYNFLVISVKVIFFQFIIQTAFLIWLILNLIFQQYKINWKNPIFILLSIFFIFAAFSNLFGIDPYSSFFGSAERADGFISWIHYYLYFILLWVVLDNKKKWIYYLYNLVFLTLILAIIGLDQDYNRIVSTLGNPIPLANFMLLSSTLTLFLIFYHKTKNLKLNIIKNVFLIILIFIFFWVIVKTDTRGTVAAFGLGIIGGSLFYALIEQKNKILKYGLLFFSLLIIFSSFLFFKYKNEIGNSFLAEKVNLIKRISDISIDDPTTRHRLANWSIAWNGIKEKPFLGWGQESYGNIFIKYYNDVNLYDNNEWFDRSHNFILDWLVYFGWIGFLLLLSIILTIIIFLSRKKTKLSNFQKSILFSFILFWIFKNITSFDDFSLYLIFYLFLALMAFLWQEQYLSAIKKNITIPNFKKNILVISGLIFIWIIVIYFYTWPTKNILQNYYIFEKNINNPTLWTSLYALEKNSQKWNFMNRENIKKLNNYINALNKKSKEEQTFYLNLINKNFELGKDKTTENIRLYITYFNALISSNNFKQAYIAGNFLLEIYPDNVYILKKMIYPTALLGKKIKLKNYIDKILENTNQNPKIKKSIIKKYEKILK